MSWGFVFLHSFESNRFYQGNKWWKFLGLKSGNMTSTFCKHLHLPNPYYLKVTGQLNSSGFREPLVNLEVTRALEREMMERVTQMELLLGWASHVSDSKYLLGLLHQLKSSFEMKDAKSRAVSWSSFSWMWYWAWWTSTPEAISWIIWMASSIPATWSMPDTRVLSDTFMAKLWSKAPLLWARVYTTYYE